MDEEPLLDFLEKLLQSEDSETPGLADLPFWWKLLSAESSKPANLWCPKPLDFLDMYIYQADKKPWAREGLRNLMEFFLEEEEDIPQPLNEWALHQYVQGDPPPKRGRPELHDRDFQVWGSYNLLRDDGLTRQASIEQVSHLLSSEKEEFDTETVRSIIRKFEKYMRQTRPR